MLIGGKKINIKIEKRQIDGLHALNVGKLHMKKIQPKLMLEEDTYYVFETVQRILAAVNGSFAQAPDDPDEFMKWLESDTPE